MNSLVKILSLFLFFFGMCISTASYGQEEDEEEDEKEEKVGGKEKKFVRKGRNAYRKGEYWKAKSYYDKVTTEKPTKPEYWLETGIVYYESQVEREKSIIYFEKALEFSKQDTMPEILYYAAKAYHFNGEYEKAIQFYNLFLNNVKNSKKGMETRQEVIREIEICNNGVDLRSQKPNKDVTVVNMGVNVNSDYPDYVPVVTNDENLILFCSRRPPGKKKNLDGLYFEDIFYTVKKNDGVWQPANVIDKSSGYLSKEINDGKAHEAPISLSPDGNTLYIYKENSVWKSTKDENGKWSIPLRMNQNVNIGTANPSIYITPDEQELFIVSVGADGGFGERDIYYARKNENGTWDKPVNLGGVINTPYKEDAPFLSKDGKTLYFASEGHNSMGGFDIFKSVRDENGVWSAPVNIGAPINSAGDDIYYVENEEGTLAYYASMRPGSFGYLDLYTATSGCKNIPTTDIKGYAIFAENHLPVNGVIKITNKATGQVMGTYNIDPKTGKYNMVLPPEQTYYLELMIYQSKYNEIRPHREEFTIPAQCEAYNLFQQISVDYLKNEEGQIYAQRATFSNAMFDIDSEIKNKYGNTVPDNSGTNDPVSQGISGNLAHNRTVNARFVEVILMNENHQILRMTQTDEFGNFFFEKVDPTLNYIIMINEDDAKSSFLGDNVTGTSTVTVQGIVNEFRDRMPTIKQNVTVYMANSERKISNTVKTDATGKFEFTNVASDPTLIANLNSTKTISYNLDFSNVEVVYSAYILHLDPNNTELDYTEYIDIIELKDLGTNVSGGGQDWENILFDFDKFFLRDKSKNVLDNVYNFMKANPTVQIRLDGHTDWFGSEPYNVKLSERRALSAHKYLIDKGIAPNRIKNVWFGETKPAYDNMNLDGSDSQENRQLNRRVEIKIEIPEMADLYLSL